MFGLFKERKSLEVTKSKFTIAGEKLLKSSSAKIDTNEGSFAVGIYNCLSNNSLNANDHIFIYKIIEGFSLYYEINDPAIEEYLIEIKKLSGLIVSKNGSMLGDIIRLDYSEISIELIDGHTKDASGAILRYASNLKDFFDDSKLHVSNVEMFQITRISNWRSFYYPQLLSVLMDKKYVCYSTFVMCYGLIAEEAYRTVFSYEIYDKIGIKTPRLIIDALDLSKIVSNDLNNLIVHCSNDKSIGSSFISGNNTFELVRAHIAEIVNKSQKESYDYISKATTK